MKTTIQTLCFFLLFLCLPTGRAEAGDEAGNRAPALKMDAPSVAPSSPPKRSGGRGGGGRRGKIPKKCQPGFELNEKGDCIPGEEVMAAILSAGKEKIEIGTLERLQGEKMEIITSAIVISSILSLLLFFLGRGRQRKTEERVEEILALAARSGADSS
ncbi:MAG: hypothetical protein GY915_06140 [bacterium]|nr:hypothetical protein [bacterium]